MKRFNWLTKKYVIFPLLLLALLAGAFPLFNQFHKAHAAAAAAPCYGRSCYGKNPIDLGCTASSSVSGSVSYNGRVIGYLTNYYSYLCNANWLQFEVTDTSMRSNYGMQGTISTLGATQVENFPDNGCYLSRTQGGWPAWTDMIDGTTMTFGYIHLCDSNATNLLQSETVPQ